MHIPAILQGLRRDQRGAALVEFAFVAPVFVTILFGMIEGGIYYWTKETLDEVAYATARCMSVDSSCDTTANQRQYAVDRANSYGVPVSSGEVTITGATTCKGDSNANLVTIEHEVGLPLGDMLPFFPEELTAQGCFPVVS